MVGCEISRLKRTAREIRNTSSVGEEDDASVLENQFHLQPGQEVGIAVTLEYIGRPKQAFSSGHGKG